MVSRPSTVTAYITGDERDLLRSLGRAGRELNDFERQAGRSGSRLSGAFRGIGVGLGVLTGATVAAVYTAREFAQAASDLNEVQNKSNEVFGASAGAIEAWAEHTDNAIGLSKRAALDAAGSFGNLYTQLGLSEEQSAQMSQTMVELAADFASFHNADITQVLQAQQAAFRGEYDSVQRFVPTINAAAVEQQGLKMGLAETSRELTAQDKALATYALLINGAGSAAGDFARTSGSLANQQRELTARIENLKAKIGAALLPVMTDVVTKTNEWIDTKGDEFARDLAVAIEGAAKKLDELYGVLQAIRDSSPYKVVIEFLDGEGNLLTVAALTALGFKLGGPALGIPAAVGAAAYEATQAGIREGRPEYPPGVPTPTRIQAGERQPVIIPESDLVRNLKGFPWENPEEANVFGDLFMQKPTGTAAASAAVGGGDSLAGSGEAASFNRAVGGMTGAMEDAEARLHEAVKLDDERNLQMAHKVLEEAELAAAAASRELEESTRRAAQTQQWYANYLQGLAQQNVRFAPGVFEGLARAGGMTPIGDLIAGGATVTQTDLATGETTPVNVVVP